MKSFILFAAFIFLAANCAFADTDAAALVDQFKQATDLQQQDLIKDVKNKKIHSGGPYVAKAE